VLRIRIPDAMLLLLAVAVVALVLLAVLGLHHLVIGDGELGPVNRYATDVSGT
jgi:hypothetical protein